MKPGDVAMVYFPFNKNQAQPYKLRPVLVLAETGAGEDRAILVAMITGNMGRYQNPGAGDARIVDFKSAGLVKESTVRGRRVWTAEDADIEKIVGTVDPAILEAVQAFWRSKLESGRSVAAGPVAPSTQGATPLSIRPRT